MLLPSLMNYKCLNESIWLLDNFFPSTRHCLSAPGQLDTFGFNLDISFHLHSSDAITNSRFSRSYVDLSDLCLDIAVVVGNGPYGARD